MKKFMALFLSAMLMLTFTACGKQSDSPSASSQSNPQTNSQAENIGKVLVVYFSASGNTENAAKYIARATNGDLFKIEPKNAYTDADLNWTDKNSRVNYEHDNESARDIELVSSSVDKWSEYDTVFIGYPIWWGIAAWPIDTFIKANDFSGKTVIPFCTSASSGLGQSGELLKETAGTGNWLEGKRFNSNVSENDINEWIKKLNLNK